MVVLCLHQLGKQVSVFYSRSADDNTTLVYAREPVVKVFRAIASFKHGQLPNLVLS